MVSTQILVLLRVDVVLLDYADLLKCFIYITGSHFIFLVVDFALVAGECDFLLVSSIKAELFAEDVDSFVSDVVVV
jgi:hypothetical protein